MKIALLLSIACAALIVTGCHTPSGASADTYETSTGTVEQDHPVVSDPSLPSDANNIGPQMTPP